MFFDKSEQFNKLLTAHFLLRMYFLLVVVGI